ncbi:MAG: hypothetical protein VX768_04695 [Planctomycetota bacterium]|nr:hypothetical protein [Planctomycetota bacterium]
MARLAGDPSPDPKNPRLLQFSDEAERNLARYYPAERRDHIEKLPHTLLRIAGGPDWEYRKLLETKMGMNSHFRGVGLTENTLNSADTRKGLPEWIGPNRKLEDLVEYAVIDMGRLAFVELHDVK